MADPVLTRALDPAQARRLLAAACDNIRGLEVELRQSREGKRRSLLAAVFRRVASLRHKVLPPGRHTAKPITDNSYRLWIRQVEAGVLTKLPAASGGAPLIYFLLIGEGQALETSLRSVLAQTDSNWRLILVTTGTISVQDSRVQIVAAAPNAPASDGYVAVIHAGDQLAPAAVAALRLALEKEPRAGMIYSDEDVLDASGRRRDPFFKPDWSPETFRAMNYMGNVTVFALPLVREVGGFRWELGEAAVYDLAQRVTEKNVSIRHTPLVLYHSREPAGPSKVEAPRPCLALRARGDPPLISIIIPSKDQPRLLSRCVESVLACKYTHQEILILDTGSITPESRQANDRLASQPGVRLLHWDELFNYSAINNFAVRHARGEVLTFLNDDTEVITPDWLERLAEHALRPNVGAVGAKLLYSDKTIQHAGIVLGIKNLVTGHLFQRAPDSAVGYPLGVTRNVSAVTGFCLMMRRSVFDEVGGFEEQFAGDYNDVDLCLKVRQAGYEVIWTPHACLFHHECQTRGHIVNPKRHTQFAFERLLFLDRWGSVVERGDPYYNPNLNHNAADGTLRRGA